jgi:hypothetical protein
MVLLGKDFICSGYSIAFHNHLSDATNIVIYFITGIFRDDKFILIFEYNISKFRNLILDIKYLLT